MLDDAIDPETLMRNAKRRKQTKEERLADVREGREGRDKYGSNKGDKQRGSTSNRVRGVALVVHKNNNKRRLVAHVRVWGPAGCGICYRKTSRTSCSPWSATSATCAKSSSAPCARSRYAVPHPSHKPTKPHTSHLTSRCPSLLRAQIAERKAIVKRKKQY